MPTYYLFATRCMVSKHNMYIDRYFLITDSEPFYDTYQNYRNYSFNIFAIANWYCEIRWLETIVNPII